jgi:TetR/AcrR family transcriptional repressor of nem operon
MKKTKKETAQTREHIVGTAALEFRRNGIERTGLADIMAAAGLTHGGFYRHFESKDDLVAEALDKAFTAVLDGMERRPVQKNSGEALRTLMNHYLSANHRDNFEDTCPLAALGSDLRRADRRAREVASAGIARMISIVGSRLPGVSAREGKARATAIVGAMVGSMVLARIVTDPGVSNNILKAAREFILQCTENKSLEVSC